MRRRLLFLLTLSLLALASCSAKLTLTATAPVQDNDGTCTGPVLIAAGAGAARMMHFAWAGPVSGEDSIATIVGAPVTLVRNVPAGTYTIRGWASNAGGPGCDTTLVRVLNAPPWKVGF